jgi:hypothetical protein
MMVQFTSQTNLYLLHISLSGHVALSRSVAVTHTNLLNTLQHMQHNILPITKYHLLFNSYGEIKKKISRSEYKVTDFHLFTLILHSPQMDNEATTYENVSSNICEFK